MTALLIAALVSACSTSGTEGVHAVEVAPPPGRIGLANEQMFLLVARDRQVSDRDIADWATANGWAPLEEDLTEQLSGRPSWALRAFEKRGEDYVDVLWVGPAETVLREGLFDERSTVEERLTRQGLEPNEAFVGLTLRALR